MGMYRERLVKKPRKKYTCDLCCKPIEGQHKYVSGITDGEFYTMRVHCRCVTDMHQMCSCCEFKNDCTYSVTECFLNNKD